MGENIEETRAASEAAEAQAAAPAFPNPKAAAAAIIAYYPELVDLDTSTKNKVQGYIRNASGFEQFVHSISGQGQSDWAPPTPIILENGQPAKDPQGNDINQLMLSEQTTTDMVTPVAEALCSVRTDSSLENVLWTTQQGIAPGRSADNAAAPAGTRWSLREVAPRYGVTVPSLSFDYSDNTFQLQLTNECARHLAVYVEFMAAGEVITPSQWTSRLPSQLPASFETDTLKYLGVLGPTNHVAGMKMTAGPASFSFSLPAGATAARLLFGGLGAQPSGSVVEAVGAILTAIMDQAIPAILLTAQQSQPGLDLSTWFNSVLADADLVNEVIAAGGFLISGQSSTLVTNVPVLLLGTSLPNLATNIGKNVGAAAIGNAAPCLGWAAHCAAAPASSRRKKMTNSVFS
jgi:hypothetical protein